MTEFVERFRQWFRQLEPDKRYGNLPPKGTVAGAIVVLNRIREGKGLEIEDHLTGGKGQIAGVSASRVARVLAEHGEYRVFLKEGGRTNRGNHALVGSLLKTLKEAGFGKLDAETQRQLIWEMHAFLVKRVADYFNLERIKFDYRHGMTMRMVIEEMLACAEKRQQMGYVAQHLVGAKLSLRFSEIEIENFAGSAADQQAGRQGDFRINDAVIHVTVAPASGVCAKCAQNVASGLTPWLLVPEAKLAGARQLAEMESGADHIVVESIETFLSQNLSEIAEFALAKQHTTLSEFLCIYNERVDSVETDKSLMVEIPSSLTES